MGMRWFIQLVMLDNIQNTALPVMIQIWDEYMYFLSVDILPVSLISFLFVYIK